MDSCTVRWSFAVGLFGGGDILAVAGVAVHLSWPHCDISTPVTTRDGYFGSKVRFSSNSFKLLYILQLDCH